MKVRSLLLGLVGGVVGTALVFLVLFLLGFADVGTDKDTTSAKTTQPVASTPNPGTDADFSPEAIYEASKRGVVMVVSTFGSSGGFDFPFGDPGSQQALGSGFVISEDGYILTNAHVVDESGTRATEVKVVFKGDDNTSQSVDAELVGVDLESDVAVLKVNPDNVEGGFTALPLGDSEQVVVGEPVVAIGNPLGYDFSVTSGIVSAVDRNLQSPVQGLIIPNGIQTDAAINQGNSGGPLLNGQGEVIGINEQIASQSGGNQGLGFAVPINTAVRSFEQIKEFGEVQYAWMGIVGQTISPDIAQAFDLPVDSGVLIAEVVEGGPAQEAGLRGGSEQATVQDQTYIVGGDIITKIDGESVTSMEGLIAIVDEHEPGDRIDVTYVRDGDTRTAELTLEERPENL